MKKDGAGSSIGGVDAAYACHPSLLAVPGDFKEVSVPLSIALGTKDSLVNATTRGGIKDALSKLNVPSEVKEYPNQVCTLDKMKFIFSGHTDYHRSTVSPCATTTRMTLTRKHKMRRLNKALTGSANTLLEAQCRYLKKTIRWQSHK